MGWGDTLTSAWNAASDTAKAAAQSTAQTAQNAYNYGKEKAAQAADYAEQKALQAAQYAKQKAEQAAEYAEQKAVQGYEYTRDKAVAGYNYAKDRARDAERAALDGLYDGAAGAVEAGRQGYNKASTAARRDYDTARSALGMGPAGKPVKPCEMATVADAATGNKALDGWIMSPQGAGKDCVAVPPGKDALKSARDRAVISDSDCCKARRAGSPPRDIIYVNGITTDSSKHCKTLKQIADQTCGRVVGIYNATEGGLIDAAQTGQDRRLVKAAAAGKSLPGCDGRNPAVDTLSRAVADEVEAGRAPEIWAHSQGGAVTSLALSEANNDLGVLTGSRNALSAVKVKSFGSAAPQWVDGPAYEHYVHMNDPVPTMLGLGHDSANDAVLAGKGAKVIRFAGDVNGASPFETANPAKELLPINLDNHAVDDSYIKMEKQQNGGCP